MSTTDELKDQVVQLLSKGSGRAMTATEIAADLPVSGKQRKRAQKLLNELVADGSLVMIRNKRYSLGAAADLLAGRLSIVRSGNAFLNTPEGEADLFIPRENTGTALPDDRVLVRLEKAQADRRLRGERGDRRVGRVIRILERARRDIVGTLKTTGRFDYVLPVSPAYSKDFYVPDRGGATVGDRVVARFTGWLNKHVNPEAEIVEVLGPADEPSVDTISIMRQFDLPEDFPAPVMRDAEHASAVMEQPGEREDLRDKLILTIDPKTARDFDDALSLEKDKAGNRVLGVHIADVSHFIRVGGELDREARQRGNSVYLPDKVIPMLPEPLSNGVCSLRPNEDRLTFSAFLTFDTSGRVVARRFTRGLIRSRHRLTYEQAMRCLDEAAAGSGKRGDGDLPAEAVALLCRLDRLAQQLRGKRFARSALNLDLPEVEVIMDGSGRIEDIRAAVNDASHQLVEECMLAANEAVATELVDRGVPLIHRFHAPPNATKIEELTVELKGMGFQPGDLRKRRNMARFLKSIQDDPLAYHVQIAVLRSMSRAVYSVSNSGHFGLAKKMYAHFTSPIRRYPDLVVHRQLGAVLTGNRSHLYGKPELGSIAQSCSETEQRAEEAERDLLEIKKCRFLEEQLEGGNPRVYEAVIVKVTNFGLFIDVPRLRVQGLVHVSSISDRFVRFNKRDGTLRDGRDVYKVGRRVAVAVSRVDFDQRRIDFNLA